MIKQKNIIWWLIIVIVVIGINIIASFFHLRFDLTQEKRYSLSEPVKSLLKDLKEPVQVEVFMKGDYPAGYRKLANSVDEFLQQCKEYSNGNLDYVFTDPLKGLSDSAAERFIDSVRYFYDISPLTLEAPAKPGDEQIQKRVLPGAVIHYKDTAIGVNFLKGERAFGNEPEQLAALFNNVESTLEFKFASAIEKVTATVKPKIGYALGNGEGWGYNVNDAVRTLIKNYSFDTVNIRKPGYIPAFDALVILKPTVPFNENDKLKIDQYIMHGGKVFWMIDNMYAEFDSLYKSKGFIAYDRGLNLEDILFNYGVRINQTLLQDLQCDKLPQVAANGQQRLVDWPFFPILNGTNHPISKNLDGVRTMFPTTIDTVEANGIKKTFLLQTSSNARLLEAPAKIDFQYLQIAPDIKEFQKQNIPVAVLLEGRFSSLYKGRTGKAMTDTMAAYNYAFAETGNSPGKMIVVSDGDIAMNSFSQQNGPLEMGTNIFTHYTYANKEFFVNSIDYLVNPSDILQTRSKQYTLRLLDPKRIIEEKTKWQFINIGLPVILVIILGFVYQQIRRYKYAK
ncbi:MAG TPA: gliding motility-associated ABC transporter substrate-binding protein GldG [Flavisolibacter sp.]|nr:gliding motility-associated ABC transporter substrate-binding protein GldG [Flavisolibacter sp.]